MSKGKKGDVGAGWAAAQETAVACSARSNEGPAKFEPRVIRGDPSSDPDCVRGSRSAGLGSAGRLCEARVSSVSGTSWAPALCQAGGWVPWGVQVLCPMPWGSWLGRV